MVSYIEDHILLSSSTFGLLTVLAEQDQKVMGFDFW